MPPRIFFGEEVWHHPEATGGSFEIRGSDEHPENRPTAGYSPSHVTMFEIPAISFQRQIV